MENVQQYEVTQEQAEELVTLANKKVEKILKEGIEQVILKSAFIAPNQRADYLHEKALEQSIINVFIKTLKVIDALQDLCKLEQHRIETTTGKAKQLAEDSFDHFADINDEVACLLASQLAIDILDEEEVESILNK